MTTYKITGIQTPWRHRIGKDCIAGFPDPATVPLWTTIECTEHWWQNQFRRERTWFRKRPIWRFRGYTGSI